MRGRGGEGRGGEGRGGEGREGKGGGERVLTSLGVISTGSSCARNKQ